MNDITQRPPHTMFCIGIDPGVNTGVAVWTKTARMFTRFETLTVDECITYIRKYFRTDEVVLRIENPNLNSPTFNKSGLPEDPKKREAAINRISQNVGMNKRDAERLITTFREDGYYVEEIKPVSRKWTAEEFRRFTGVQKRVSQHVRDAARMCIGA